MGKFFCADSKVIGTYFAKFTLYKISDYLRSVAVVRRFRSRNDIKLADTREIALT
jgi:hypothetical protein